MTPDRDTILDRVRKLLRLGESSNPNEAAAALAAAQKLIDRHRLSELELGADEVDETVVRDDDALWTGGQRVGWRGSLAAALCRANGVAVCWSTRAERGLLMRRLILAGRPEDIAVVRHLFGHCSREIDRLASAHCAGRGRAFHNAFRFGCVQAIAEQLGETRRQTQSESAALVVRLDERIARARALFGRTSRGRASFVSSSEGIEAGRRAGRSIHLHAGALSGGSVKRLGPGR